MQHLTRRQALDKQIHQLEQTLADQRADLMREAEVLRERIDSHESVLKSADSTEVDSLQVRLQTLQSLDVQRNAANKTRQNWPASAPQVTARMSSLKAEGTALNQRLDQLQNVAGAICPLCGQALTEAHRDQTVAQLGAERDAMRETYRDCVDQIREIDQNRRSLDEQLETWAMQLKDLPALQQQLGAARQQSRNAEAAQRLEAGEGEPLTIAAQLANQDYGHEIRAQWTRSSSS